MPLSHARKHPSPARRRLGNQGRSSSTTLWSELSHFLGSPAPQPPTGEALRAFLPPEAQQPQPTPTTPLHPALNPNFPAVESVITPSPNSNGPVEEEDTEECPVMGGAESDDEDDDDMDDPVPDMDEEI